MCDRGTGQRCCELWARAEMNSLWLVESWSRDLNIDRWLVIALPILGSQEVNYFAEWFWAHWSTVDLQNQASLWKLLFPVRTWDTAPDWPTKVFSLFWLVVWDHETKWLIRGGESLKSIGHVAQILCSDWSVSVSVTWYWCLLMHWQQAKVRIFIGLCTKMWVD